MDVLLNSIENPLVMTTFLLLVFVSAVIKWGEPYIHRYLDKQALHLREIFAYSSLNREVGRAVESGQKIHFSLGNGGLNERHLLSSVAASDIVDHLSQEGCDNGVPPLVTVGDGSLIVAAQDSLRHAFDIVHRPHGYEAEQAQFLASNEQPFVYAAAVGNLVENEGVASNILVGHFGAELLLISESVTRTKSKQIVGVDDPVAMALAYVTTDDVLLGEELLAAGSYLNKDEERLYHLQIQDLLRLLTIGALLFFGILQLWGG